MAQNADIIGTGAAWNAMARSLPLKVALGLLSVVLGGAAAISEELVQPPICSAAEAAKPGSSGFCSSKLLGNGHNEVTVGLKAQTSTVNVAGYSVETDNYNGNYLTPIIVVMPGDTVGAHLQNALASRKHEGMAHGDMDENPTNLHLFHGGVVSPSNARPKDAALGNGDNVYVHLRSQKTTNEKDSTFDFEVPVPGDHTLDARVFEASGYIDHPSGLNWYHSHMHGISSYQVMGGLSGLLSVGDGTANVRAACSEDPNDPNTCLNDVAKDTDALKTASDVRYALLRDLPLKTSVAPAEANGAAGTWAPEDWDPKQRSCGVFKQGSTTPDPDPKLRDGFCQFDNSSVWLFTINGQRFPSITVKGGRNVVMRMGNLSSNAPYWLELRNEDDGTLLPLTLLSVDGVVPALPRSPEQAAKPIAAKDVDDLLLMPASRAEVYVRNDAKAHNKAQTYILQTKAFRAGPHKWPAIRLARIVLEPNIVESRVALGLQAVVARPNVQLAARLRNEATAAQPVGCVRDLDPSFHEYRRVTFEPGATAPGEMATVWRIKTELIRPPASGPDQDEGDLPPIDPANTAIEKPFESYVKPDGSVDWEIPHVCIKMDHLGSHKQMWVLFNLTGDLHNFHIHQMKFRLATKEEIQTYHIKLDNLPAHSCPDVDPAACRGPDYRFYDTAANDAVGKNTLQWHDTIPVPAGATVFVMMSFDAQQQVGRFVFHCHILDHEDHGLMAPIEVWDPKAKPALQ